MTRLRIAERRVLDTLVNAGVANSRGEALSWCVSFVSKNEKAWLSDLRDAFKTIEKKRRDGPKGKESWSDRKLRHDLRRCPPPGLSSSYLWI